MAKRSFAEVRKAVLEALSDGKEHTYGELERTVNTNWQTVRDHIENLVVFQAATLKDDKIKITTAGREALRRM